MRLFRTAGEPLKAGATVEFALPIDPPVGRIIASGFDASAASSLNRGNAPGTSAVTETSPAQIRYQTCRAIVAAKQIAKRLDRSKHLIKIARIRHVNRDVLLIELLRKRFQLRRRRNQNDLRLERDDALDAGMHRVADL